MQTFQQYYPVNQTYNQPMPLNPYMQRMEQLQQYQQAIQPPAPQPAIQNQFSALGKVVENIDTVKTTEIPYQGVYYFPTADGSVIYSKQWLPSGQTQILAFKPILEEETVKVTTNELETVVGANSSVLEGIMESINTLHEKIDKISKQNTVSKAKKEIVADE